jgi:3-dehydroquinate synthase
MIVAGVTEVIIGRGLPSSILPERDDRARAAILTQPGASRHALTVAGSIESQGIEVEVIGLPDRDEAKTLDVAQSTYESFARFGLSRHDTVVGVGGGSVTDLGGFVAATWLRGVEAVFVPTTLLGAVDASIGGKTGVNLAGKNLVGVFWHPSRVVIDVVILENLPAPLRREGMAESLKTGLVGDPQLFALLERDGEGADLEEVVTRATRVKGEIVDSDERERSRRSLLNLGHTVGHAIEFASALSHGESVAIGTVAAAYVSEKVLSFPEADRVRRAITHAGLPVSVEGIDRARVVDLIRYDKKRDSSGTRMVLLRSIGDPILQHVDEAAIDSGLSAVGL